MKTLTFFNNKGGVGKTSLVYHLANMFAELGVNVIAIDLDPQSNLSSAFLSDSEMERLWADPNNPYTIEHAIQPVQDREGDVRSPHVERVDDHIGLIAGDLQLSLFEDRLAVAWGACLDDNLSTRKDAIRAVTSFYRIMLDAAKQHDAELVLVDVGPNLGALNRAVLVSSDYVVVPLAADLFSLHGLRNLGPTLRDWRAGWATRVRGNEPSWGMAMPSGRMSPIGYIIMQPVLRENYPVKAFRKWTSRIPMLYAEKMLDSPLAYDIEPEVDLNRLATLKNYRSLAPFSHDARKPMFMLTPADGAVGGHVNAVKVCFEDFKKLAVNIAGRCGIALP